LLEQAIAIDRRYGAALALAAVCHMRLIVDGWVEARETSQALQVGQNDPGVLTNAAAVLAQVGEDNRRDDRAGRPCAGA